MKPSEIRKSFFSVLSDTEKNIQSFVCNPGADMTRHRSCCFQDTVLETMCLTSNRTNTELLNYFGISERHIPTNSAFTQQRKKFNSLFFPHLLDAFNKAIPFNKTYRGWHLVAVDGTDINLPTDKNDTVYRVKQARSDGFYYQMHVNALLDICEDRYVSALIQPRPQMDERAAFSQLVEECSMPKNTIFIADRGYVSFETLAHLMNHGKYFLIRSKSPFSANSPAQDLIQPDTESDQVISIGFSRSKKNFRGRSFDKCIKLRYDRCLSLIPSGDKKSVYAMNVRITCVKLSEDSYEYLISNLPVECFSQEDLKDLYWKRWSIETSFRRLKYALSLAYLHSVRRDLIIQEIFAKMILYNFVSLLHAYGQDCLEQCGRSHGNDHDRKVSFDDAAPLARELLKEPVKNRKIKALLLSHLTEIRKSVMSPRTIRSQSVRPLNNRA